MNDLVLTILAFAAEAFACIWFYRQLQKERATLWSLPFGTSCSVLALNVVIALGGVWQFAATGERRNLLSLAVFIMGFLPSVVVIGSSVGLSWAVRWPKGIALRIGLGILIPLALAGAIYLYKTYVA